MSLVTSFSGIRGIYGRDLTDSMATKYCYSYLTFLRNKTKKKNPTIVLGMDTRPSSIKLMEHIMGILDCNFIDIGIAPIPAIEFAVRHFNANGGIAITASHNEPYWNGLKFFGSEGSILNALDMNAVISNAKNLKEFHKITDRNIIQKNSETIKKYTNFIYEIIGFENIRNIKNSNQKVILDPNGGAGIIARKILEEIGVSVIGINMNIGEFNRKIEPTEDSLIYLKNPIDENKADFAAGFDCDADRVEILMENGQLLSGSYILALVVDDILSNIKNPKSQFVVVNDATSNIVRYTAEKHGAKIKEVEVGETNVIEAMKKFKSPVGGEGSSGGVIISPSKCRDGILTLLALLSIVAKKGKKLDEIVREMPVYHNLKEKIEFDSRKHDEIKKYLENYYSKKGFELKQTGGIMGGLKILISKDSFVWFRASKTESSILRIIADSTNKEEAVRLINEAVEVLNNAIK